MKRLVILAVSVFAGLTPKAQSPSLSKFSEVNDTIVAKFNSGDYKGIYALAGNTYKKSNREGGLVADLIEDKNFAGNIISSKLARDLGKVKHFIWTGEKARLRFELWMDDTSIVRFKLNDFVEQPGWPKRPVLTDNPLKTALDSIVQEYASVYISSPKAVGLSLGIYFKGKMYEYNYGEVEKGTGTVPGTGTIYTLGSVTKTFIGLLLAKAVTENKLNLQDDIRKYLTGSFPNLEYQGHPVRLVDLATHTWGFGRFRINFFPPDYETV